MLIYIREAGMTYTYTSITNKYTYLVISTRVSCSTFSAKTRKHNLSSASFHQKLFSVAKWWQINPDLHFSCKIENQPCDVTFMRWKREREKKTKEKACSTYCSALAKTCCLQTEKCFFWVFVCFAFWESVNMHKPCLCLFKRKTKIHTVL